jgi:hypothetical protein
VIHWRRSWVVGLYMVGLIVLSSLPAGSLAAMGLRGVRLDAAHVPLYAGLALVTLWAARAAWPLRIALTGAACTVFALADEWYQGFVPGRVPQLEDLFLDGIGIVVGLLIGRGLGAALAQRVSPAAFEPREGAQR